MTAIDTDGDPDTSLALDLYPGQGVALADARAIANGAEASGLSGLWSLEAAGEPFLPLAIAAEHTERLLLRTTVAVAFARNPMVVAQLAHELNVFSRGRFQLGLGSQVRAHVERRFSQPWSRPAARMREFVLALRAIWSCWNDDVPLRFEGEFYRHTLMTPMFAPEPSAVGPPPVLLAAVGPRMTAVAAEVADGIVLHPLTSPRYVRERTLPALGDFGARVGDGFELSCPVLVISAEDDAGRDRARSAVRQQVAFYASTPAYREVFGLYDEADRADRLYAMSRDRPWEQMAQLITDELLAEFAVDAPPSQLRAALTERYGGLLDRAGIYAPYAVTPGHWHAVGSGDPRS